MCGKYFINQELLYDLRKQFPEIGTADSGLFPGDAEKADIVPSMNVPVLYCSGGRTVCSPMIWGFPDVYESGQLVINARAETLTEKPMFRNAAQFHRCAVPAAGFYEWTAQKEQVSYTWEKMPEIFLGAVFRMIRGSLRFVIVTRETNASVRDVHGRMPLVLDPRDAIRWLGRQKEAAEVLNQELPQMKEYRAAGMSQLSFL